MPSLSIVLPCYNESKSLHSILERFSSFDTRDIELILVNNGSTDDTANILKKELKNKKYKFAKTVLVEKNKGYGFGIITGLKSAKGDFLAFSHADMQCDPADIFRAYEILLQDFQRVLVKGNRRGRKNFFTSFLHILAFLLFLKKFDDINGQPKVFPRLLYGKFKNPPLGFTLDFYVQYMAIKNGFKINSIPVEFAKRKHGQSHWSSSFRSRSKTIAGFIKYIFKLRLFGE